jgi:hypothetical protein
MHLFANTSVETWVSFAIGLIAGGVSTILFNRVRRKEGR